jgi:RNA-dependent RNA polymerase
MRKSQSYPTSFRPSCIQFRLGGAKGVLVHDPRLQGDVVCLRDSQTKFSAPDRRALDIASTSARPIPMFLNRPLIAQLEHLGVPDSNFFNLQENAIENAKQIRRSFLHASTMMAHHGLGQSFRLPSLLRNLRELLDLDCSEDDTPGAILSHGIIDTSLAFSTIHILREIKHRARIFVPGSVTLIGVSDEWDCLGEREIYAHIYDPRKGIDKTVDGRVLITRSPQIHPGDAQYVTAVCREEVECKLGHLTNVVVFPCR